MRSRWLDFGQIPLWDFIDRGEGEVYEKAKKNEANTAILTKQAWSIKDLLMAKKRTFSCGTYAGNPEPAKWAHLAGSGSQSERSIRFILPAHGFNHIIIKINETLLTIGVFPHWTFRSFLVIDQVQVVASQCCEMMGWKIPVIQSILPWFSMPWNCCV